MSVVVTASVDDAAFCGGEEGGGEEVDGTFAEEDTARGSLNVGGDECQGARSFGAASVSIAAGEPAPATGDTPGVAVLPVADGSEAGCSVPVACGGTVADIPGAGAGESLGTTVAAGWPAATLPTGIGAAVSVTD